MRLVHFDLGWGAARMGKAKQYQVKERVQPGQKGVLVTCFRNSEAKCINELYFLLNQSLESLSPEACEGEDEEAPKGSFEDQIKAEVGTLTSRKDKPFISMDMKGLQCIVFLKAHEATDVLAVVESLFDLVRAKSIKFAKFCQRILPIEVTCYARIEDIRIESTALIRKAFPAETTQSFCVAFESRFNDSLDKMTVINMVVEIVGSKHKVNLTQPNLVILIQVFQSNCGISVLRNWTKNRKYNIQEVLKATLAE